MAFEGTDRFTVRRVLGEGANGVVYEAVDNETGLSVALKTLRTLSADTLFQFKQEFRSIQNLHHPNLVELFELSSAKGTWFFTMQLVEGTGVLEYVRPSSTTVTPLDTTERLTRFENLTAPGARELAPVASVSSVGGALDLARLRSCMAQVAEGLKALHDAGKVHRDIKPNNMLVTREGRVVILDFGLAAELRETARPHVDAEIAGTVAYMAPEQAAAGNVTAAADWYALGVVLFEALTGRLPFVGPAIDVLLDKQAKPAPDPRQFNPDLPAALADLTVALLATDPAARPGFGEVLAKLQTTANVEAVWASTSGTNAFVGRGKELEALNTALAHTSRGPQAVCISGESGLGKTTLVRQFIRGLERQTPAPWVCEGACYQRESVPYKGIDGALDTLATALSATDHVAARALLPPDAGLLSLSFPVLSRVQAFAEAPREEFSGIDASTLRQRLFVALRELLRRVSQTQPVVLVLDDIQWAGEDTWALLREVFRSSDGPNVLLVTTLRLESDAQGLEELVRHRHAELRGVDVTWLGLGRLSANESSALARQLLRRLGAPLEWVDQMVLEAAGHPLLLDALARGGLDAQERTLDKLIMKRVRSLAPPAQRVLEFASMSNAPVVQHALARAAELDFGLFSKFVGGLKVLRLVRTSGSRALDTLQPFHDRVRQVVAASLSAEARRGLQERLALALESVTVPDSEALAWHWAQAGDAARAARHAERAGGQAMERLAFERAAYFYQQAVAFSPNASALNARLAEALVGAGRGAEAAVAFEAAAANSSALEALEYSRRAAHEYLRCGQFDRGRAQMREVLAASGDRLLDSTPNVLASFVFDRIALWARGLRFTSRPAKQVPASTLLRIDATWSASEVLSTLDVLQGAAMQTRNLRLALAAGEPLRIARSLAMEAGVVAVEGAPKYERARAIHQRAEKLAAEVNDRATTVLVQTVDGIVEFLSGRLNPARVKLREVIKTLEAESLGTRFALTNAQLFLVVAQVHLGQWSEFLELMPRLFEEATRRGDTFALTQFRVNQCNVYWLAQDAADAAADAVTQAAEQWSPRGFQTVHYYQMLARAQIALYQGNGSRASELVRTAWPHMKRNFLLRAQMLRSEALHLRGRAAWAAGDVADAERCRKLLEKEDNPFARGLAAATRMMMGGTPAQLDHAEKQLEGAELLALLHAARCRRFAGTDQERFALHWFSDHGVRKPEAMVDMLMPRNQVLRTVAR